MIQLTRLNGSVIWLNPLLFESVEQTPDTVILLTNGHRYVIREDAEDVSLRMAAFFRQIGLAGARVVKEESG
ncbi:MAG: flagellar FlbD family protein [Alicyclobacillus sp.]|nr:flagellar FlbD family protein [Alicyclobacillus sp.]MCL6515631.1 flagellar FlbD family protein [Alicyclobacillus sp.]